jgi:hypothetical protein
MFTLRRWQIIIVVVRAVTTPSFRFLLVVSSLCTAEPSVDLVFLFGVPLVLCRLAVAETDFSTSCS